MNRVPMVMPAAKGVETALVNGRKTGSVNLANRGLEDFPLDLCNFNELAYGEQWWELIELQKLDMTYNYLRYIPKEMASQETLVMLRIAHNKLESIPDEIFTLPVLKLFDASYNFLTTINFSRCTTLVEVNLQNNRLGEIPPDIGELSELESFNVSENGITALPHSIGHLGHLRSFDISKNLLKVIPSQVGRLLNLEQFVASKNSIEEIENGTFLNLMKLKHIDLSQNKLSRFNQFPASSALDSVILAYNFISIFEHFEDCPGITVLDLKNNKLTSLPASINVLRILKTLDMSNNDLIDLPNELASIGSLVRINIEGNPLRCIRQSIKTQGAEVLKKYLEKRAPEEEEVKGDRLIAYNALGSESWDIYIREASATKMVKLVSRNIKFIANELWDVTNITQIDLSINQIENLSADIRQLVNLEILRLNENQLTDLPSVGLGSLYKLQELEISRNYLHCFLDDVTQDYVELTNLKRLDLSGNRFTELPRSLTCLPNLRVLVMHTNQIVTLDMLCSPAFCMMESLNLAQNKIVDLPDALINSLKILLELNLENNSISNLPDNLGFHQKIRNLRVEGNPFKAIRRTVLDQGTVAIMNFLRNRASEDLTPQPDVPREIPKQIVREPVPQQEASISVEMELVALRAQVDFLCKKMDDDFSMTTNQRNQARKELAQLRSKQNALEKQLN